MRNKAIRNVYPNVMTISDEKDCWDSEGNKVEIDNSKIKVELQKLETEFESKQYQRDRAVSYPPLAEQMDLLYHGGIDALKAELKKTKNKYPKP